MAPVKVCRLPWTVVVVPVAADEVGAADDADDEDEDEAGFEVEETGAEVDRAAAADDDDEYE